MNTKTLEQLKPTLTNPIHLNYYDDVTNIERTIKVMESELKYYLNQFCWIAHIEQSGIEECWIVSISKLERMSDHFWISEIKILHPTVEPVEKPVLKYDLAWTLYNNGLNVTEIAGRMQEKYATVASWINKKKNGYKFSARKTKEEMDLVIQSVKDLTDSDTMISTNQIATTLKVSHHVVKNCIRRLRNNADFNKDWTGKRIKKDSTL